MWDDLSRTKSYVSFRREIADLRGNTQQPMFQNVVSLAMANGVFYWTNGEEVLYEEYHPIHNNYFHNAYPDQPDKSFVSVSVNLPTSQPIPIPVNPPTNVQAILGAKLAKTSWQVPHLLGGQGDYKKSIYNSPVVIMTELLLTS
jgi:proto-oncogene tyrosine-protein kinase ROS